MNKFPAMWLKKIVIISLLSFSLLGCSPDKVDKNEQIIALVKAMETAIESKHVDDFMVHISDAIQTERGWGKKDIERLLRLRLMRRSSVHIHPQLKDIKWNNGGDDSARVEVAVAMAATEFSLAELAKINADLMSFQVTFKKNDDSYIITGARWQRAQPLDFL